MQNKMSLINFNAGTGLSVLENLLIQELKWLLKIEKSPQVLFIPDAYDGAYYNSYLQEVKEIFSINGGSVTLTTEGDPATMIKAANCIVVGGGSLKKLLEGVNSYKNILKTALKNGIPYLGWNEGAVLPCPYYIFPAVLPLTPVCLGATSPQVHTHYIDSDLNREEIGNFLVNHKNTVPSVKEVICFSDHPGGSGIRLEDDNIALSYGNGSGSGPNLRFALDQSGHLITL